MVLLKKAFSIHHPLGSPFGTPKGRCWVVMFCHCRDDESSPCSELYADREASKPPPPPPVWKLVLANKKRWFSYGFHDGKGSGDFVCHSSVRKHPKPKSVWSHRFKNFKHLPGVLSLWAFRAQGLWKVQASKGQTVWILFCNSWCVFWGLRVRNYFGEILSIQQLQTLG